MNIGQLIVDLLQTIFNGLALGSVIALAAVGLTLTYGILRLSNFAHGDFMTLGAYFTWLANVSGLNLLFSMFIGALGTVGAMLLSEQLLWKPMRDRRATSTTLMIISIGLALFVRHAILVIWGGSNQSYNLSVQEAINVLGIQIAVDRLWVIGLSGLAILALHFLLQRTKIGKAMRAVSDSTDLARVAGINVEWVVFWTWVMTGVLTAVGGAMLGLIAGGLRPQMGWFLILPIFAAVILGGIGNPYGAITGAFIIGIAQELSVGIAQVLPWKVPLLGADYKLVPAFLIMIVILLIRPQGLFKGTI